MDPPNKKSSRPRRFSLQALSLGQYAYWVLSGCSVVAQWVLSGCSLDANAGRCGQGLGAIGSGDWTFKSLKAQSGFPLRWSLSLLVGLGLTKRLVTCLTDNRRRLCQNPIRIKDACWRHHPRSLFCDSKGRRAGRTVTIQSSIRKLPRATIEGLQARIIILSVPPGLLGLCGNKPTPARTD
jgi:hypothetical protein